MVSANDLLQAADRIFDVFGAELLVPKLETKQDVFSEILETYRRLGEGFKFVVDSSIANSFPWLNWANDSAMPLLLQIYLSLSFAQDNKIKELGLNQQTN